MLKHKQQKKSENKKTWLIVIVVIVLILILSLVSYFCYCNSEEFSNVIQRMKAFLKLGEFITINDITFQQIGTGPAIDINVMTIGQDGLLNSWQSASPKIPYRNHENDVLQLTDVQFRAINGFIPPSFVYHPFGSNNDDYRAPNAGFSILDPFGKRTYKTEEGNRDCIQACIDTQCIAVQTEVPELCFNRRVPVPVPEGISIPGGESTMIVQGDCNGRATHACTLFYKTIEDADDAYYKVSGGYEALQDPNKTFKGGLKYYENDPIPKPSPNFPKEGVPSVKPSEEIVKWCDSKVVRGNNSFTYKTKLDAQAECTCTRGNCDDPNCCVFRSLLTTNWAKFNTPYYNLPINVTTVEDDGGLNAVCEANEYLNGNYVGWCGVKPNNDGTIDIKSCPQNRQFLDGTPQTSNINELNNWWRIPTYNCVQNNWWDDLWNGDDSADRECLEEFQEALDGSPINSGDRIKERQAFSKLLNCCNYRDQACVGATVQPFCSLGAADVQRGCYGDPQILNVDEVVGDIGACSNPAIIAPANRCVQDAESKVCKAFPYGCETGPLWKPVVPIPEPTQEP